MSYLSFCFAHSRHWKALSELVLRQCNLGLKLPHSNDDDKGNKNVIILDLSGPEPQPMGMVNSMAVSDLITR